VPADWDYPPLLVPLFPVRPLTPTSECGHKTRIRRGSVFVCMVCHKSGQDHRAYFKDVEKPRRSAPQNIDIPRSLTRKERRELRSGIPELIEAGELTPEAIDWYLATGVITKSELMAILESCTAGPAGG
jgi:hypothetical protein